MLIDFWKRTTVITDIPTTHLVLLYTEVTVYVYLHKLQPDSIIANYNLSKIFSFMDSRTIRHNIDDIKRFPQEISDDGGDIERC